ncbi:MAG TPA: hypothetical protein VLM91_11060 [Candidatus Methylomirabilis sp.]|nr:hypothetical protein [Candidatus Methylomirabilis sp.]
MRKIVAITLAVALTLAALPGVALAGDSHAVSNRWAGVAIGAAAAVVGGMLLNAFQAPVVAPPVAYSPPPVVYSPPPVIYTPPPVVYAPAPVVVHRSWGFQGHSNSWNRGHRRGWENH